jgi:hypothetical protein
MLLCGSLELAYLYIANVDCIAFKFVFYLLIPVRDSILSSPERKISRHPQIASSNRYWNSLFLQDCIQTEWRLTMTNADSHSLRASQKPFLISRLPPKTKHTHSRTMLISLCIPPSEAICHRFCQVSVALGLTSLQVMVASTSFSQRQIQKPHRYSKFAPQTRSQTKRDWFKDSGMTYPISLLRLLANSILYIPTKLLIYRFFHNKYLQDSLSWFSSWSVSWSKLFLHKYSGSVGKKKLSTGIRSIMRWCRYLFVPLLVLQLSRGVATNVNRWGKQCLLFILVHCCNFSLWLIPNSSLSLLNSLYHWHGWKSLSPLSYSL